jgi:FSR family fosmidomycin resistance protein-like MFS transporter
MRLAFLVAVPGAMILTNSTSLPLAVVMLLPLAIGIFVPYSPVVILGQTYLGKNVGLASGITMGLASTLGGVMSPVIGWSADKWGVPAALQILWIAALIGVIFSFVVPDPDKISKR